MSSVENDAIIIQCIRQYKCWYCKNKEECERQKWIEYLEEKHRKENEREQERCEMLLMSKEDERTIQKQLQKEQEHIQMEQKIEKERLEVERMIQRQEANMKKMLEQDKSCLMCKINYCKCETPKFVKNEFKRFVCNTCKKQKCLCSKIEDFFTKHTFDLASPSG
jgi:hypothetical protein